MNAIDQAWERASPLLQEALVHARGTHEIEDILRGVAEGQLQLWVAERSAAVSEILRFPRKRVANLFLAAGDLDELQAGLAGMEAWARGQGCSSLMTSARLTPAAARKVSGWTRAWPSWEPGWIVMHKELK